MLFFCSVVFVSLLGASSSPIDVYNIVDLRGEMNREIIMRVTTDIKNPERQFYSDLNGFQVGQISDVKVIS